MTFAAPFASPRPSTSMNTSSGYDMGKSWEENTRACGERLRNILREIHPQGTAKLTARDSSVPMRTMERILDGTSVPSFDTLIRLFAAYPRLLEVFEPVGSWAAVAAAAVECETLERRRDAARLKAADARAKLRSLR